MGRPFGALVRAATAAGIAAAITAAGCSASSDWASFCHTADRGTVAALTGTSPGQADAIGELTEHLPQTHRPKSPARTTTGLGAFTLQAQTAHDLLDDVARECR